MIVLKRFKKFEVSVIIKLLEKWLVQDKYKIFFEKKMFEISKSVQQFEDYLKIIAYNFYVQFI